jgi:hypothetical protein
MRCISICYYVTIFLLSEPILRKFLKFIWSFIWCRGFNGPIWTKNKFIKQNLVGLYIKLLYNISVLICFAHSCSYVSDKPGTVGSLVSLDHHNHNNNNNNTQRNSLKASLSLDPAALAKQPLPYVNVNMTPSHIVETGVESQGRPFTIQGAASRNLLSDNEISCWSVADANWNLVWISCCCRLPNLGTFYQQC